jgi:hypothetical protein
MTDQATAAPAAETAAPDAAALAAAEAAQAKTAHDAAVADLTAAHGSVGAKLGALQAALADSLAKAKEEPGHVSYTASFLRDVDLKADEIIAWIKRHV